MNEKCYTITLADGTVLSDLNLNGNNYISKKAVTADMFTANCSPVVIVDGETEERHENMELVQIKENNGEYWFILRDISNAELEQLKMQSDIEYVAMMTGVEL